MCGMMSVTGATLDALAVKGLAIDASPGFTIGTSCKHGQQRHMCKQHSHTSAVWRL
jgi:hypothetical protein